MTRAEASQRLFILKGEMLKGSMTIKMPFEPEELVSEEDIEAMSMAIDMLKQKKGKWIDHQDGRWIYAKCSECGTVHDVPTAFCPSCGAAMEVKK